MSSELLRRHEALQLLVEVLDDDDLWRRHDRVASGRLEHQEPLAVGGDVVVAERAAARQARTNSIVAFEHFRGRAGRPSRPGRHADTYQCAVRREIEEFLTAPWAHNGCLPPLVETC